MNRYRIIAQTLLELTRTRQATVARLAEIHRSNFATWLAGQDSALSTEKQLEVCAALNWCMGSLRRDIIWRIHVAEDLSALNRMLTSLDSKSAPPSVYIFQTEGRLAAQGAVLMAKRPGELVPLVMLLTRPLADHPYLSLASNAIANGKMGGIHQVSEREWKLWWHAKAPRGEVTDYLSEFGNSMLEQIDWAEGYAARLAEDEATQVTSQGSSPWALSFQVLSGKRVADLQSWFETLKAVEERTGMDLEQLRQVFLESVKPYMATDFPFEHRS